MNFFVSFESDEDNLAIEPAIRHTIVQDALAKRIGIQNTPH